MADKGDSDGVLEDRGVEAACLASEYTFILNSRFMVD